MADISEMNEQELGEELERIQAIRNSWMDMAIESGDSGGSSDLPDFSVIDNFPSGPDGDAMRAAYSRRFNNALNKIKDKTTFNIPGYISNEIYANVTDQREEIKKQMEKKGKKETFLDLSIGDIIKNTIRVLVNFQKDIHYNIYKVELEERINNEEYDDIPFKNFKRFMLSFFRYLNSDDNILYIGFFLMFLSIILYLFNILRG